MTIRELIEKLQKFPPDMPVIIDDDGDTYNVPDPEYWDENNQNEPVAFFLKSRIN